MGRARVLASGPYRPSAFVDPPPRDVVDEPIHAHTGHMLALLAKAELLVEHNE
jgi:hypothetical protein